MLSHPLTPLYTPRYTPLHPLRSRFEETLEAERGAAAAKVEGFQREVREAVAAG